MIQRLWLLRLLALSGAFVVLLASGCGELGSAEEAAEGPEPPGVVKDRESFIPRQVFGPLKEKMVGVLLLDARDIMRGHEQRYGPDNELTFSTGGTSYRWVYVWDVNDKDSRLANPADAKRWGITVPYALVEAESDRGFRLSAEEEHFLAKTIKRLDGTADYPLDLPSVVSDLRKRYRSHVAAPQTKVDSEMEAVKRDVLRGRQVTGPKRVEELMYLTWLPDRKRVRAAFQSRFEDAALQETTRLLADVRGGPPDKIKVKYGVRFGVELGKAYEVDVKGNIVATDELPPQRFSEEIPLPPE